MTNAAALCAAQPTGAEQVRSVLAAAESLTVTTNGHRCDLAGLHSLDTRGRLTLELSADSHLAVAVACAPRGNVAAMVEFTDVAPTAVRDRVRARVVLSGWLTPVGPEPEGTTVELRLYLVRATLETEEGIVVVGLDELVLAEADPLAGHEAGLLLHLTDAHPDSVAQLARLVDLRHLHGVLRVWPLRLDRYGITLRLEYARGHRDIRVPFSAPVHAAAEVGDRIQTLLAAAHACPRRRRQSPRP
ncbi:DUF2470 domain-containing protein [Streptomyces xantholiticus]